MLDQIFINAGHLYKFPPQNTNMHVYEHRQAVDMAVPHPAPPPRADAAKTVPRQTD